MSLKRSFPSCLLKGSVAMWRQQPRAGRRHGNCSDFRVLHSTLSLSHHNPGSLPCHLLTLHSHHPALRVTSPLVASQHLSPPGHRYRKLSGHALWLSSFLSLWIRATGLETREEPQNHAANHHSNTGIRHTILPLTGVMRS